MRLLTGLIRADAGSIQLLGEPFGDGHRGLLFKVGALIEAPAFYPYLSGRANLRALAATGAPTAARRVDELLDLVGLRERGADKVSRYSLGMKQRLGIAAALLSDPTLLLLDEPANGLDPGGIAAMRETLRNLASAGKTVFVSSHLLSEIQQMADVVGIVNQGRLVREGPIQELLSGEGHVRARVAASEVPAATSAAEGLAGPGTVSVEATGDTALLTIRIAPMRSADVNRALAAAGVYASSLDAGADLESLFLELTGGDNVSSGPRTLGGVA
jgi:ABC-2 type transport system ATP-binding protein